MKPVVCLAAGVLFACLACSLQADSPVVFNEIMYHPLTNEAQLEWVELQNQMSVDVDISHWFLDGEIHFTFVEGTIIRAGEYLVIAIAPATLSAATGLTLDDRTAGAAPASTVTRTPTMSEVAMVAVLNTKPPAGRAKPKAIGRWRPMEPVLHWPGCAPICVAPIHATGLPARRLAELPGGKIFQLNRRPS